ncbi:hypothetical protein ACTXT7_009693 [Hymenolepis weldensis]
MIDMKGYLKKKKKKKKKTAGEPARFSNFSVLLVQPMKTEVLTGGKKRGETCVVHDQKITAKCLLTGRPDLDLLVLNQLNELKPLKRITHFHPEKSSVTLVTESKTSSKKRQPGPVHENEIKPIPEKGETIFPSKVPTNNYPLPVAGGIFATLNGGTCSAKFDLSEAYLQVEEVRRADLERIRAIVNKPSSNSVEAILLFLGLISYNTIFLSSLHGVRVTLNRLLQRDTA